jgi:uncharacterized protein YdhG (YjbR/CyaY superfamily)
MKNRAPADIDGYIAGFPADVQKILQKIRKTIQKAAPDAKEVISYQMPAFRLNRVFIYFGGYTKHVSVYPAPRGVAAFKKELAEYEGGKGTVQFPLDQPVPYDLITRIVKYRVEEDSATTMKKATKSSKKR